MKLVRLRCTQCGANLPEQQAAATYQCSYCGSRFTADRPAGPPAPSPPSPVAPPARPRRRSRLGLLWGGLTALVPVAIGSVVLYFSFWPTIKGSMSGVRLGSPLRAVWDGAGGPGVPVTIKGQEAVLGLMRLAGDELFVVATDSATAQPLWKIGPLGTYGEGYPFTFFQTAGDFIVVSDARGLLRIHALATGKEVKTVALRDRATALCPGGPDTVAIAVRDRHHVAVDLGSLTLHEAPLPALCESGKRAPQRRTRDEGAHRRRLALRGFDIRSTHLEGEYGVAGAVKSPGTPTPYALGFTPQTREVSWQQVLPTVDPLSVHASEHDGLAAGRYLAVYGVGSAGWHLTALAAKDGARLWDTPLRPLFAVDQIDALTVTAQYAYVNRTSSLEIYAAATGKLLGTVGNETYRSP